VENLLVNLYPNISRPNGSFFTKGPMTLLPTNSICVSRHIYADSKTEFVGLENSKIFVHGFECDMVSLSITSGNS